MKTTLRIFMGAKKYWCYLILALIAVIVSTVAGFYNPWALRELTSLATEGSSNFGAQSLRIGLMLLVATILQSAGSSISGYLNHHAALHYVADTRTELYSKLQHMGLKYFNKSRTGDLTSRVINDVMEVEVLLAHIIPDFVVNILTFIGVGILLFSINVKLAFFSLVTIPFLIGITLWQSKYLSPIWKENSRVRGELSGTVQDNFSGIKEIQIFNQQDTEEKRVNKLSMKHSKAYLKASFFFETTFPLLAFFTALGSVIVIIVGGMMVSRGEVNIGDIVGFSMYLGMFYGPIKSFSRLMEMAGTAVAGCRRVFEVLDEVPDVKESANARKLSKVSGKIEFKDVSFSYNDEIGVLENINLNIKPGETVAFVGTTGVGKTTIASLLNRFYDLQKGSILIDGEDIKDVTLKSLRDNISMVLQDTFLFNGTIYENIVYGWKEASKEQVLEASKAANAHEFIKTLENSYDTVIGERGVRLSGGQKQRISIARAILRNSPILILDEATSALDTKTEKEIQAALDEISKDRTTIVIAHRLSTIRNADKIVVLERNGIKEMGSHDELIRNNGTYAMLYRSQVS
ncbi:ABC transporter ATP-binding protein [Clostridium intestinale]|uniref:ABC-type multidrug transport system, ATPase and permease component n=1 Tax=Clostridium intestinale DSM 6191 TaxID=1121320 RepID=A0A1M6CDG4_9CLOT|nr:ABC transporter ATP-binding protein [Clostridium intestinale]SHI58851.1 ABC-type multidrug transport system, ATPase and permease component [Clostridium intestinale DSM 6191]